MHLPQLFVREMVPRARITVQQRWRFDELLAPFTSLALVCIVRVAQRIRGELEQRSKIVLRKVPCGVFGLVNDASGKVLLLTPDTSARGC